MSESLRDTMVKMAMGKAPVRTKGELQAFLESQRAVTYEDRTIPIESGWKDGQCCHFGIIYFPLQEKKCACRKSIRTCR